MHRDGGYNLSTYQSAHTIITIMIPEYRQDKVQGYLLLKFQLSNWGAALLDRDNDLQSQSQYEPD